MDHLSDLMQLTLVTSARTYTHSCYGRFMQPGPGLSLPHPTPPNLPPNPNNMLPASFYNANTQAVLNITDIYNLKQLITDPTRITPLGTSLIDVSFTNLPDNTNCSGVSHIGISDHSLI